MKRFACFIVAVFYVVSCTYGELSSEGELDDVIPKLPNIASSRPKSLDTQLGIAFLYVNHGTPDGPPFQPSYKMRLDHEKKLQAQFDRVLAIDPNNKAFWAMKSKRKSNIVSARFFYCLKELNRLKEHKLLPYTLFAEPGPHPF